MEDLLILILQALFEVLAGLPWDWLIGQREAQRLGKGGEAMGRRATAVLSFGLGAALGGLSLLGLPNVIAKVEWLRLTWLIAAPLISGALACALAWGRVKTGEKRINPAGHFWRAFLFTLGLVAVRFAFGVRA